MRSFKVEGFDGPVTSDRLVACHSATAPAASASVQSQSQPVHS